MKKKLTIIAAGAALSLMALTGCGGADTPGAASSSSAATPQMATATSPARNITLMAPYASVGKSDTAGLSAFSYYWFDVQNYAIQTGDTAPLAKMSDPTCAYCNDQIKSLGAVYKAGGWIVDGQPKVLNVYPAAKADATGNFKVVLEYRVDASTTHAKDGKVTASTDFNPDSIAWTIEAKYTNGSWKMVSAKLTPGVELAAP